MTNPLSTRLGHPHRHPYDDVNAAMTTKPVCRMIWRPQRDPQPPPNKKRKNRGTDLPPSPPGFKRCNRCFKEFDDSHFINDKSKRAKQPTKRCKTCRVSQKRNVKKSREKSTTKYNRLRQLYLNIRNFTRDNYDCWMCKRPLSEFGTFEFDHIVPETKRFNVSHFERFKSREDFLDEWARCQPLCTACHEIKTRTDEQDRRDMPASTLGAP